jgi:hypothetical protein
MAQEAEPVILIQNHHAFPYIFSMNMPQTGMGQLEQFVSHKRAFDHKSIPKRRRRSKQRAS